MLPVGRADSVVVASLQGPEAGMTFGILYTPFIYVTLHDSDTVLRERTVHRGTVVHDQNVWTTSNRHLCVAPRGLL
jgi:hypothetical protein